MKHALALGLALAFTTPVLAQTANDPATTVQTLHHQHQQMQDDISALRQGQAATNAKLDQVLSELREHRRHEAR